MLLSGLLDVQDALGVVQSDTADAGVSSNAEFQVVADGGQELQGAGEVQLELLGGAVVADDPVLSQVALRGFQLVDRLDGADERVGTQEELQDGGVGGAAASSGGDDAIHVVGDEHRVRGLLHVGALDNRGRSLVQDLQHLVSGDGCVIEPLAGDGLVNVGVVKEAIHGDASVTEVGDGLDFLLISTTHSIGAALLQVHAGHHGGGTGFLDAVSEGGTQAANLMGDFLTQHVSAGQIAGLVGNQLHLTLCIEDAIGEAICARTHLGRDRQHRGILDVGVLDLEGTGQDLL